MKRIYVLSLGFFAALLMMGCSGDNKKESDAPSNNVQEESTKEVISEDENKEDMTFNKQETKEINVLNQKNKTMEVTITTENFESYKNGALPLVVDLWATWCGPCRAIAPIISELAEKYDGKIIVGKCDVEENDDIAIEYGVRNIPTILFFKNGEVVDKMVGAASKAKIEEKFQALL